MQSLAGSVVREAAGPGTATADARGPNWVGCYEGTEALLRQAARNAASKTVGASDAERLGFLTPLESVCVCTIGVLRRVEMA